MRGARDVNGADIVRIARGLAVEPWYFTQPAPAATDDPGGIVIDQGRRRVTLHLATAAHGCVFLVRTLTGGACCGLGNLAPISCRVFPADPAASPGLTAAGPVVRSDPGCSCRDWTAERLAGTELMEPLRAWNADRAHWYEVVARWNAGPATADDSQHSIEDFQRYLLEAQSAREAGAPWPEEALA